MNWRGFALFVAVLITSGSALACSTCLAGDPTLTLMGAEKPFVGRKRIALEWLDRSEEIGIAGFNRVTVDERRWSLGFSYTPNERLSLGVRLPWLDKQREDASLARVKVQDFGDVEITAKFYLQSRTFGARDAYGLIAGLRLPTATEQRRANGMAFDIDTQAGTGAVTPQFGGWYARYAYPWFAQVTSVLHVAGGGFQDFRAGAALATSATGQRALTQTLALQLGIDTRWSARDQYASEADPDSGGFIAYLSPGLVYTLREDLLVNLRVQLPIVDALNGNHDESVTFGVGIVYDF
ncbi:MAG: hypothetical protein ACFCUG_09515 [Thiotrichales bacterium]